MIGAIERLGGALVAPRATFSRLLGSGEGGFGEVLLWLSTWALAVEPEAVGRGLSLVPSEPGAGALMVAGVIADRLGVPLGLAVAGAVGLALGSRRSGRRLELDRALDL